VALAAALIASPRVLLLDEPEAHLDEANGRNLLQLLKQIQEAGPTSVIILDHPHSPYREWADECLLLEKGHLAAVEPQAPHPLQVPARDTPTSNDTLFQTESIHFQPFPEHPLVFQELTLSLSSAECVHLRGQNGNGKSTLLRTLLQPPGSLKASIQRPTLIGYLPQEARDLLLHHNVDEEFAFLLKLYSSLSPRNVEEIIQSLGLETIQDRECRTLSAGEEQMVALGLVLASPASVFFLDEPTSHLDREQAEMVLKLIGQRRSEGATFLIASQDSTIEELFDRSLQLDQGRLLTSHP
jgi:ABC-type multidrug transport system ATPase subunit